MERNNKRINFNLSPVMAEKLDKIVEIEGRSVSEIMREMVNDRFIKDHRLKYGSQAGTAPKEKKISQKSRLNDAIVAIEKMPDGELTEFLIRSGIIEGSNERGEYTANGLYYREYIRQNEKGLRMLCVQSCPLSYRGKKDEEKYTSRADRMTMGQIIKQLEKTKKLFDVLDAAPDHGSANSEVDLSEENE